MCTTYKLYLIYVYMAEYSHIHPYMLHIYTQEVQAIASKLINSQESGVHYTKLTQLWCSTTQLLCRGLQNQPSYPKYIVFR